MGTVLAPDWRPYRATAAIFCLAIALNLWTGNGLWLAYTLTGTGIFGILVGLVRIGRLRPPASAVWLAGIAVALHYVGGSMAGVHQVGGINGMYAALPWWDNVVHFLGSFAVGVAAFTMLRSTVAKASVAAFLAACVAVTLGVFVELYEFSQFVWFGTVDQGFYTNTLLDLYYNCLGAAAGVGIALRLRSTDGARDDAGAEPGAARRGGSEVVDAAAVTRD